MRIAILTSNINGSPLILARSLQQQLKKAGVSAQINHNINLLNRLVTFENNTLSWHFWLKEKISNYFKDSKTIKWLKEVDAVVICDCIPNGYWKRLYNVEKLKKIIQKPIAIYEVFNLANAPTQIRALQDNGDPLHERYEAHLYVSEVTELKTTKAFNAFCIGLMAENWELKPEPKKKLMAIVDFKQSGYENYRDAQISMLQQAGIEYISLERRYEIQEIRELYQQASVFFIQCPEAFGLPILECLCSGAQIFTPDSGWPMSWRLNVSPEVHGPGILPDCFTVYGSEEDLLQKLQLFKANYDPVRTPGIVFENFIKHYPTFYEGDIKETEKFLSFLNVQKR